MRLEEDVLRWDKILEEHPMLKTTWRDILLRGYPDCSLPTCYEGLEIEGILVKYVLLWGNATSRLELHLIEDRYEWQYREYEGLYIDPSSESTLPTEFFEYLKKM